MSPMSLLPESARRSAYANPCPTRNFTSALSAAVPFALALLISVSSAFAQDCDSVNGQNRIGK